MSLINRPSGLQKYKRSSLHQLLIYDISIDFILHKTEWNTSTSKVRTKIIEIYVEIKCQLDATEVFIADLIACSSCFGHHYAHHQELKSIIQWLLPVVFGAVVFNLLVWCGAECYVSGLQNAAA